jgi:hypothetical protein
VTAKDKLKEDSRAVRQDLAPVFLHSLFRTGSTYMFNVFRRSQAGYWPYQEPLNEIYLSLKSDRKVLESIAGETEGKFRHPALGRPYFFESFHLADQISEVFDKSSVYDRFFSGPGEVDIGTKTLFTLLLDGARGRPVLQECRSSGRIGWFKQNFAGTQLHLWREPRSQWISYQVDRCFDRATRQIVGSLGAPAPIRRLRDYFASGEFHASDFSSEVAYYDSHPLGADANYGLFLGLWIWGQLQAMQYADLSISIDELARPGEYRSSTLETLERLGVSGLDFSDCSLPLYTFRDSEADFFRKVEATVEGFFLVEGVDKSVLSNILHRAEETRSTRPGVISDPRLLSTIRRFQGDLAEVGHVVSLSERNNHETRTSLSRIANRLWVLDLEISENRASPAPEEPSSSDPKEGLAFVYDSLARLESDWKTARLKHEQTLSQLEDELLNSKKWWETSVSLESDLEGKQKEIQRLQFAVQEAVAQHVEVGNLLEKELQNSKTWWERTVASDAEIEAQKGEINHLRNEIESIQHRFTEVSRNLDTEVQKSKSWWEKTVEQDAELQKRNDEILRLGSEVAAVQGRHEEVLRKLEIELLNSKSWWEKSVALETALLSSQAKEERQKGLFQDLQGRFSEVSVQLQSELDNAARWRDTAAVLEGQLSGREVEMQKLLSIVQMDKSRLQEVERRLEDERLVSKNWWERSVTLEVDLERRRGENERLLDFVRDTQGRLNETAGQLADELQKAIVASEKSLSLEVSIQTQRQEMATLTEMVASLRAENSGLSANLAAEAENSRRLAEESSVLENDLSRASGEIDRLAASQFEATRMATENSQKLQDEIQKSGHLWQKSNLLESELEGQKKESFLWWSRSVELEEIVARLKAEASRSEQRIALAEGELLAIRKSAGWRLLTPFRFLVRSGRKVKAAVRIFLKNTALFLGGAMLRIPGLGRGMKVIFLFVFPWARGWRSRTLAPSLSASASPVSAMTFDRRGETSSAVYSPGQFEKVLLAEAEHNEDLP